MDPPHFPSLGTYQPLALALVLLVAAGDVPADRHGRRAGAQEWRHDVSWPPELVNENSEKKYANLKI